MRGLNEIVINQLVIACLILTTAGAAFGQIDVSAFIENFENNDKQIAYTGTIDSLTIDKLQTQFIFGPGEIAIFDFGQGESCVMAYRGQGRLVYVPPNRAEHYQLHKFTDQDELDNQFDRAIFFYTVPIEGLPDKSKLAAGPAPGWAWNALKDAATDAFQHLGIYLPNELLDDLLGAQTGKFLYADLDVSGIGHLAFMENPAAADCYRLFEIKRSAGVKMADQLAGYSPDELLPSERGIKPFDIYHYDIDSKIEAGGKMTVDCRIHYIPMQSGRRFLNFAWFYDNEVISALDQNGDSVYTVSKKEGYKLFDESREESGIGVVLNRPTVTGESTYIDIRYNSKCLEKQSTIFFIKTRNFWYPHNRFRNLATYTLTFDCPDKYEVISCGEKALDHANNGRRTTRFRPTRPAEYIAFNVGSYRKKQMVVENAPPVEICMVREVADISNIDLPDGFSYGTVESRLGHVGADVANSLALFGSLFGPCPFDHIIATSQPLGGLSSPGLIFVRWSSFLAEDMEGYDESLRAHEVSHQWWGHVVDYESYRDQWIIEGLAEYCGWWYYEVSEKDKNALNKMLEYYRSDIISGTGLHSEGTSAGPPTLGFRLNSSKSIDHEPLVYSKGAYIFHMIRYLLHDYKTGSDDGFVLFLKDLLMKYSHRPITTERLQQLLESHVGSDMSWFFDQWVYGTYIPGYTFSFKANKTEENKYKVEYTVKQSEVPVDFKMIVPITILFDEGRYIHMKIWVDKPETVAELPLLPYKPKKIIFNTYDAVLAR